MPDVGQGHGDEFGAAHRRSVAEQDDRGIAVPDRRRAVDAEDDRADLVHGEGSGQPSRRGSVGAYESAAYPTDGLGGDGVLGAAHAVYVSDRGTRHIEGAGCLAGFGAFSQVCA